MVDSGPRGLGVADIAANVFEHCIGAPTTHASDLKVGNIILVPLGCCADPKAMRVEI